MKRRDIIKSLAVAPFVGGFMAKGTAMANSRKLTGLLDPGSNIYESIGVEPVINCRGTFTIIGGSIERPEVLEAIHAASGYFVQYDELAFGVGQRLGELTGAEFGIVTAGCAAAMKHATAACVAGGNPERLIRIPDLSGMEERTEVITPRHSRNVYDHSIRNVGVKMITVDTPEELRQALSSKTAMIYTFTPGGSETGEPLSVEAICEIAKPFNVPVLVDAAAEDLTIPNVHLQRGATMVAYSGGKAICGPQCAGLLLGPKSLLMSAWQASSPHHGPGRDNKVGKEEMLGMLAAVEAWTTRDHKAEWKRWESWLKHITDVVTKVEGVTSEVRQPRETISGLNNRSPRLTISWNPEKLHITGEEVAEEVARTKPRMAIGSGRRRSSKDDLADDEVNMTSVNINPAQMQPGEEKIVADRLYAILSQKRQPKSNQMKSPAGNIAGRWKVDIDFFSSKSTHTLFLEQEGNWIQGSHQGDFSVRELVGMIEGDQVKLRSNDRHVADRITNIFHGKLSGDTITGEIFMGEYLTAEFKATKNPYEVDKTPVVVPGGPPLAT